MKGMMYPVYQEVMKKLSYGFFDKLTKGRDKERRNTPAAQIGTTRPSTHYMFWRKIKFTLTKQKADCHDAL
jgi:hypothetical protein